MSNEDDLSWLNDVEPSEYIDIDERDYVYFILDGLDIDAQILAIKRLFDVLKQEENISGANVKKMEEYARLHTGIQNERAVEELVALYQESVFRDAANSMAAVGMLAPTIESLFYQVFNNIRLKYYSDKTVFSNARFMNGNKNSWDCHYYWKNENRERNLVKGIIQLAEAIGLSSYLPNDMRITLEALFEYRNNMFHNGFEWPEKEIKKFDKRINDSKWPETWFQKAESNYDPWIFYLSEEFINHCIKIVESILYGLGAYCKCK